MSPAVSTYAFVNAKLRARIAKLLTRSTMLQIAEARSLEEAIHILDDTDFASAVTVYSETGDLLLTELEVQRVEQHTLREVRRYAQQFTTTGVTSFVDAFLQRFALTNAKNALRLWYERTVRERSVEEKLPYLIRTGLRTDIPVEAIVNADTPERLIEVTGDAPFGKVLEQHIGEVTDRASLFPLEIALDRWYYQQLQNTLSLLNRRDQEVARRLVGIEIDVINVNWLVRLQTYYRMESSESASMLLSGGATMDRTTLEKSAEASRPAQALTDLFQKRLGTSFGSQIESPSDGADTTEQERRDHGSHQTRTLALLEGMLQDLLLYECRRQLGGYPFTIGIILAYTALKEQEARMIMTALNGKYYDLDPDRIGALL